MPNKRTDIQGLRGWAIIMVVLFHFYPKYFPNGYIGVDVFFVISGFLIAMIISEKKLDLNTILLFYYKRIKRIFPLYYLVIVCVLLALLHSLPHKYQAANKNNAYDAITLTSNIKRHDIDVDYERMILGAENPLTHTWSLAVEIQFYLLIPLIFVVQRIATTRKCAFFAGIGLCSAIYYGCVDEMSRFYSVFARIWQFAAGALAFISQRNSVSTTHQGTNEPLRLDKGTKKKVEIATEEARNLYVTIYYATSAIFVIIVSFSWKQIPDLPLRICITLLSAAVIRMGAKYQTVLLRNYMIVHMGDLSYALYLIHWPMQVIVSADVSCSHLVRSLCLLASIAIALLTHHIYEKNYLKGPAWAVLLLVAVFIGESVKLYHRLEESEQLVQRYNETLGSQPVDYSSININDAAWNYTLMRYLNFKESVNHTTNMRMLFCEIQSNHTGSDLTDYGYCSKKNGTGDFNIVVIGNSYACNQADIVYHAFKHLSKNFDVLCVPGCDLMSRKPLQQCHINFNYSQFLPQLKPDVIFILSRAFAAKERFDPVESIQNDEVFKDYMDRIAEMEGTAKKVYLLQDMPTCVGCVGAAAVHFTDDNRMLREIKGNLTANDDFFARQRIYEVEKRCRECVIVDYLPMLVDRNGHYYGYNPDNNLLYFDIVHHINRFAKERIQPLFNRLAKDFEKLHNKTL